MLNQLLRLILSIIFFGSFTLSGSYAGTPFDMVSPGKKVSIIYDPQGKKLDSISAHLLASDIEKVTGYLPAVSSNIKLAKGQVILIGSINSGFLSGFANSYDASLKETWERYSIRILNNPVKSITQALVIAGSDPRGTTYGVFSISELIGVSPWAFWADVKPHVRKTLSVTINDYSSVAPSVKFRGIFINDEDWGLQPWAAKTFERKTGDIGPKTYAKVFELLLRLKFNLIWPAMHSSTKPFFTYRGSVKAAEAYEIVVGSSHAEPMLRSNVGEWNEKTMGHFNYVTNRDKIYQYWEDRVKESSANNVMYTIGMRGVHDSGMQGVKSTREAVPLLERIFKDQREMFSRQLKRDATKVPQIFAIYKEVLNIYEAGLKVPEDVTLVWPDDNYGYIQRLSNTTESRRPGGSGVYYHASYWGRPHDYLWLSTTHPGLIREEMTKAYTLNAKNMWVLNIGDIKPAEYDMQLFADMAYNIGPFMDGAYTQKHLKDWLCSTFGAKAGGLTAPLVWQYYQLAFERRPEFMGWSKTEPTTPVKRSTYNHTYFGDQAQRRIDAYLKLVQDVKAIRKLVPADRLDAWFELVDYPTESASLMNQKMLYLDKANEYAGQGRRSSEAYLKMAVNAYEQIQAKTRFYNDTLAGGKWKHMMSMMPRNLPVFGKPQMTAVQNPAEDWSIKSESTTETNTKLALPTFYAGGKRRYFIDIFLGKADQASIKIKTSAPSIQVSSPVVTLVKTDLQSQARVWVEIDWNKAPKGISEGNVEITDGKRTFNIAVNTNNNNRDGKAANTKSISGGYLTLAAKEYSSIKNQAGREWVSVNGLGTTGTVMEVFPLASKNSFHPDTLVSDKLSRVDYDFYAKENGMTNVTVVTLPTHALNNEFKMRYAISIDNGPLTVVDFRTFDRSEEWKENVLSNKAIRELKGINLTAGKHTISIFAIDPGVILDHIFINQGAPNHYGVVYNE